MAKKLKHEKTINNCLCVFFFGCGDKANDLVPEVDLSRKVYILNTAGGYTRYYKNGKAFTLAGMKDYLKISSMFVSGDDVYIAGTLLVNNVPTAYYWKNGSPVLLSNGATANAIYVDGNDVYVAGEKGANAVYWKNGNEKFLESNAFASAISVSNGIPIIVGNTVNRAKYWKNGTAYILESSGDAGAGSVYISGSDIYIGGFEIASTGVSIAKYWKNGASVNITNGSQNARINTLFVNNGDVYAGGYQGLIAKYWKNGVEFKLTDGSSQARVNSIFVNNGDVYAAGYIHTTEDCVSTAKYWKNNMQFDLPLIHAEDRCVSGEATKIFVTD